jgi:predicted  nucleic acid-binding Zn-ribbon protein
MSGDASYLRCRHCKGFYETSFARCKWCNYDDPIRAKDGEPRVFPDRETCRAIQIAEYEQLPPEAHADCMGPPKNDPTLLCNCLHCGPDGHIFEAIEMRWMTTERMWACPCTTCGGRGFSFDIHSAEDKWQCAECGHFYTPANNDHRSENAKCPKCGSTYANGWFDDGSDEDEYDPELDEELSEPLAATDRPAPTDHQIPWDDDEDEEEAGPSTGEYDLGISWQESDEDNDDENEQMLDDIDHPRIHEERDKDWNDDDIPF